MCVCVCVCARVRARVCVFVRAHGRACVPAILPRAGRECVNPNARPVERTRARTRTFYSPRSRDAEKQKKKPERKMAKRRERIE